jgi:hypothetical protein
VLQLYGCRSLSRVAGRQQPGGTSRQRGRCGTTGSAAGLICWTSHHARLKSGRLDEPEHRHGPHRMLLLCRRACGRTVPVQRCRRRLGDRCDRRHGVGRGAVGTGRAIPVPTGAHRAPRGRCRPDMRGAREPGHASGSGAPPLRVRWEPAAESGLIRRRGPGLVSMEALPSMLVVDCSRRQARAEESRFAIFDATRGRGSCGTWRSAGLRPGSCLWERSHVRIGAPREEPCRARAGSRGRRGHPAEAGRALLLPRRPAGRGQPPFAVRAGIFSPHRP